MLTRVAVIASDGVAPFELGVLSEVFGTDRSADGLPRYEFSVCTHDGQPVRYPQDRTRHRHRTLKGAGVRRCVSAQMRSLRCVPLPIGGAGNAPARVRRAM